MKDSKAYEMPPVAIGMAVQWFPSWRTNETKPTAALVTDVSPETISVGHLSPGCMGTTPVDGVRHVSDPRRQIIDNSGCGCWRHVPSIEQLECERDDAKERALEALEEKKNKELQELELLTKPNAAAA